MPTKTKMEKVERSDSEDRQGHSTKNEADFEVPDDRIAIQCGRWLCDDRGDRDASLPGRRSLRQASRRSAWNNERHRNGSRLFAYCDWVIRIAREAWNAK